jgi:hypothetical protein
MIIEWRFEHFLELKDAGRFWVVSAAPLSDDEKRRIVEKEHTPLEGAGERTRACPDFG